MERCKTCQYWTLQTYVRQLPVFTGTCSNDKFVYTGNGGYCQEVDADGLLYWDYEGYSAGFSTGEDFGCIHYHPKEQQ